MPEEAIPTSESPAPPRDAAESSAPAPVPELDERLDERLDEVIPPRDRPLQPVIGLGGSAGSLNALRTFFSSMPADSGLAFVVVVHLLPNRDSNLVALLQGSTAMPVLQVRDAVSVEANHVYVIPPANHLSLADGQLRLSEPVTGRGQRVAVDLFFRTNPSRKRTAMASRAGPPLTPVPFGPSQSAYQAG